MTYEEKMELICFSKMAARTLLVEFQEFKNFQVETNGDLYDLEHPTYAVLTAQYIFKKSNDIDLLMHNHSTVIKIYREFTDLDQYKNFKKSH